MFRMNVTERWQLLKVLTISSWRSRYRNSILGFAWGVLEPLSMTIVFVLVFSLLTHGVYQGTTPYLIYVLSGQVLWSLFAQGTTQGGNGILLHTGLVKKVYFPREYLSLGYIFTILLTTLVNLVVFAVLFAIYGLSLSWTMLVFPALLGIEILLVLGISLLLASLFVRVEDLRYLWQLATTLGLFASPVIYQSSLVPQQYVFLYQLNPMVGILDATRDTLLYGTLPPVSTIVYPAVISFILCILGFVTFRRSEHLFAERL